MSNFCTVKRLKFIRLGKYFTWGEVWQTLLRLVRVVGFEPTRLKSKGF